VVRRFLAGIDYRVQPVTGTEEAERGNQTKTGEFVRWTNSHLPTSHFSLLEQFNVVVPYSRSRARDSPGMIRFTVRVHPGSSSSSVGGTYDGALQVHVRARAVDDAATKEVCAALADAFGVRPSAVQCTRGARSRTKLIAIEGNEDVLAVQLSTLLSST